MGDPATTKAGRNPDAALPAGLHRAALVVVAFSWLVVAALGLRYAGEDEPRWLDKWALIVVHGRFAGAPSPARWIIGLADPLPLAVIATALAVLCLLAGRRRLAVLALVGPVATGLATVVLKPLIDRTKDGDLAYPSGHTGTATALALVAGLLLVAVLHLHRWAAAALVTAVTVAEGAAMSLAMTLTDYHYLTDTVGGFCTAVSIVLGLALLLDRRSETAGTTPQRSMLYPGRSVTDRQ
jgi:membrane-associated phospholipid phosphatase